MATPSYCFYFHDSQVYYPSPFGYPHVKLAQLTSFWLKPPLSCTAGNTQSVALLAANETSSLFTHKRYHDDDWSAPKVLYASRLWSQLLSRGCEGMEEAEECR